MLMIFSITSWQLLFFYITSFIHLFACPFIPLGRMDLEIQQWAIPYHSCFQSPLHLLQFHFTVFPNITILPQATFFLVLQLCKIPPISKLLHAFCPLLREFCPSQSIPKAYSMSAPERNLPWNSSLNQHILLPYCIQLYPILKAQRNTWNTFLLKINDTKMNSCYFTIEVRCGLTEKCKELPKFDLNLSIKES